MWSHGGSSGSALTSIPPKVQDVYDMSSSSQGQAVLNREHGTGIFSRLNLVSVWAEPRTTS